jgi:type IV pilus assembly protein PilW
MGCLSRSSAPITYYANPKPVTLAAGRSLFGYENGAGFVRAGAPPPNPTSINHVRGDVLLMQALDPQATAVVVEDTQVANEYVRIDANPGFAVGEYLVIADCERASVFRMTAGGAADRIGHGAAVNGGLETPDNRLRPPYLAASRPIVARFGAGPTGYFIGNNVAGQPTLYRFSGAGGGTALKTEAVVDNIEDIDFLYGVDNDGDGGVDAYLKADAMAADQWDRVLSVRVSLVATSGQLTAGAVRRDTSAVAPGQVIYFRDRDESGDTVVDAAAASADRQLRQVFTTTVALRNRLP